MDTRRTGRLSALLKSPFSNCHRKAHLVLLIGITITDVKQGYRAWYYMSLQDCLLMHALLQKPKAAEQASG